jgi:hypothetical protein
MAESHSVADDLAQKSRLFLKNAGWHWPKISLTRYDPERRIEEPVQNVDE